jgi:hypothetical protein
MEFSLLPVDIPLRESEHRGGARIEQAGCNQLVRAIAEGPEADTNFAHVMPFENCVGWCAPRQPDHAGAIHRALADAGKHTQGFSLSGFPKGIRL